MATYMHAPEFGKPTPQHQQDAAARHALEPAARPAVPVELPIVTHTPQPWRRVLLAELPSSAAAFWRKAARNGYVVHARMAGNRAVQLGMRRPNDRGLSLIVSWSMTESGVMTARGATRGWLEGVFNVTEAGYIVEGMSAEAARARYAEEAAEAARKRAEKRAARAAQ